MERRAPSSEMLCRMALARIVVSEERSVSIIKVKRIGEIGISHAEKK
jgi:hypothetical protein